jgi:hypothetical protein
VTTPETLPDDIVRFKAPCWPSAQRASKAEARASGAEAMVIQLKLLTSGLGNPLSAAAGCSISWNYYYGIVNLAHPGRASAALLG